MASDVIEDNAERDFAVQVVRRLQEAGFQALFAGGCVRDLVMGKTPEDYDVATSALPTQVRELFGHRRTLAIGAAFGVIVVLAPNRKTQPVEVATFRTDAGYSDGRRPDAVSFSTDREDAQRRDFTINGMFYDPLTERVIDYVGGERDLELRVIRAIGDADARIGEDKLRMLRAVRFAARFGFDIEPATYAAITRHASSLCLVSGERIAIEVQKTLVTDRAAWGAEQWGETGLLDVFFPEVEWSSSRASVLQLLEARQSLAERYRQLLSDWRMGMASLIWAGCPAAMQVPAIGKLKERLRWANDDSACIQFAITSQPILEAGPNLAWSQLQPYLVHKHSRSAVHFLRMRSCLDEQLLTAANWLQERLAWPAEKLDPPPLLQGQDLMDLGFKPSPDFKRLIFEARCLQLDGRLSAKDQARAWALQQKPAVD